MACSVNSHISLEMNGITAEELQYFLHYEFPSCRSLKVICPGFWDTMLCPPVGYVGLYTRSFTHGNLRIPLCTFVCEVLEYFRIHISRMSPDGFLKLTNFIMICKAYGCEPSVGLFRAFFNVYEVGGWFWFRKRRRSRDLFSEPVVPVASWKWTFFWIEDSIARVYDNFALHLGGILPDWDSSPGYPIISVRGVVKSFKDFVYEGISTMDVDYQYAAEAPPGDVGSPSRDGVEGGGFDDEAPVAARVCARRRSLGSSSAGLYVSYCSIALLRIRAYSSGPEMCCRFSSFLCWLYVLLRFALYKLLFFLGFSLIVDILLEVALTCFGRYIVICYYCLGSKFATPLPVFMISCEIVLFLIEFVATLLVAACFLLWMLRNLSTPDILLCSFFGVTFKVTIPPCTGNLIISWAVDGIACISASPGLPKIPLYGDGDRITRKFIRAVVLCCSSPMATSSLIWPIGSIVSPVKLFITVVGRPKFSLVLSEDTPLHDRSNPHKSSRRRVNQEDSVFNRLGSRFPRSIVIGPQNQEEPPREGGERRVNTDNGFGIQHQGQEQGTDTRKYRNGRDGRTPPRRNRRSPSNSSPCSSSDSDRSIRRKRSNSPKGPSSSDSSSSSEDRNPRHRSSKRTKRKESLPWRRQKTDAFVKSIRTYSDKEKRRLPSQVKTYDGKGDPDDHLNVFETVATNENWPEAIWCRQFNSTLVEHARTWFDKLPKRSIGGYEDLRRTFRKNFTPRKKCVKNPVELARVKQRQGETTDAFMDRYKDELLQVKNCPEILQISGFMNGINNQDLIKKLNDRIPSTFDETMKRTRSIVQGEAAAAENQKNYPTNKDVHNSEKPLILLDDIHHLINSETAIGRNSRITDDLRVFSGEEESARYTKFFDEKKIAECRRFMEQQRFAAVASVEYIRDLTTIIEDLRG
ncbi:reverse transcriptase domain-containing protein [Tanacetum coccineum]